MCTAVTFKTKDFYFGRTLDNKSSYIEEITITPRNFPLEFQNRKILKTHFAIIGMAYVVKNYPLYYDAVNEKGLCMAGLNFVGNAVYRKENSKKTNIAQFEFISWILSQCETVDKAKALLKNINITDDAFSDKLPPSELHWIIADKTQTITVESVKSGIKIYDNPLGILTNNPTFDIQLENLKNYSHLTSMSPKGESLGLGAVGLPGDLSSRSRFVRAFFIKKNSVCATAEYDSVTQFFHILGSVAQVRGCCEVDDGYEITIYSSCCNADKGIYYYTTYQNSQITAVDMNKEDLNKDTLIRYPLIIEGQIAQQNQ